MTDQLALIPETPPTLRLAHMSLEYIEVGAHPPVDHAFITSIQRFGVMQPPVVRETAFPRHKIVDGRRRVAAAQFAETMGGPDEIDVLILGGDCSPEVLALMLNEQRSNNPVSDLAAIEALTAKGADIKAICAATGLGKGTVEKRMRLKNLILSFRYIFNEGKLPMGIAERLAKLPAEMQGDLFIHYAEVGKLTHGDISEVRYAQQQAALATLPSTLFDGTPEDATGDAGSENSEYHWPMHDGYDRGTEAIQQAEDFYLWAQKQLATILVAAPPDAPKSAMDALGFAAQVFADIGEAQAPGFLADDERVDISDVVITDPEPYDEEYTEEHIDAA